MQVLNKLVSKRVLCVEESVHVLFAESNTLNKKDTQDEDFKLGLARKDLVFMHEKGKCSEERSGPAAVSKK